MALTIELDDLRVPEGKEVDLEKWPTHVKHAYRSTRRLPERGRIGIFNRSYYEEVLIVRVHPELENHLHRNGTRIIKIFLHQSKDEQRKRFVKRIDDPDKNWKLSIADVEERKLWERYMQAYEACLSATSTTIAAWYVVPADGKKNARLIISKIIVDVFKGLEMAYPKPSAKRRRELHFIRGRLEE